MVGVMPTSGVVMMIRHAVIVPVVVVTTVMAIVMAVLMVAFRLSALLSILMVSGSILTMLFVREFDCLFLVAGFVLASLVSLSLAMSFVIEFGSRATVILGRNHCCREKQSYCPDNDFFDTCVHSL